MRVAPEDGMAGEKDYAENYDEAGFQRKLTGAARAAGREVVEKALVLYYVLGDPATPTRARNVIVGALGYFILPTDAVPDFLPGVGYTDDLGALVLALGIVAAHIRPEHLQKAREKTEGWFG
jgi:uncharacterized membrane protein YkvA (DUF1232 family)